MHPVFKSVPFPSLVSGAELVSTPDTFSLPGVDKIGEVKRADDSPNVVDLKLAEFTEKVEKAGLKLEIDNKELAELKDLARQVPVNVGLFTDPKLEQPSPELMNKLLANPEVRQRIGHGYHALHALARSPIDPPEAKQEIAKVLLDNGADLFAKTFPTNKSVLDLARDDPEFTKFIKAEMRKRFR